MRRPREAKGEEAATDLMAKREEMSDLATLAALARCMRVQARILVMRSYTRRDAIAHPSLLACFRACAFFCAHAFEHDVACREDGMGLASHPKPDP